MQNLAYHDFKVEGSQLIMVRLAILHTMLTSKRSTDGYSKLIYKSDLDKLKGSLKEKAVQVEQLLVDAWGKCQSTSVDARVACFAFGKLSVRLMLLVLGKQKFGRDQEEMENFQEIVALFAQELQGPGSTSNQAADGQEQADTVEVKDLLQASAADMALLQHPHIKVGSKQLGMCYAMKDFLL